jgi:hypothetical protein
MEVKKRKPTFSPAELWPRYFTYYAPSLSALLFCVIGVITHFLPYMYLIPLALIVWGVTRMIGLNWWVPIRIREIKAGRASGSV